MPTRLKLGTARAVPGDIAYGRIPVLDLPAGGSEEIPVIIIDGRRSGPVIWVTANIHGGELTGIASIHQLATPELAEQLSGTLIMLPTVNPAALHTMQRYPYYEHRDPNRLWPAPNGHTTDRPRSSVFEQIARQLYDLIVSTKPAVVLDLHNASIDSVPFTIRDRVLARSAPFEKRVHQLAKKLADAAQAFGLSVVNESEARHYVEHSLHRSLAGSIVNTAGIPALTIELGMGMAIDPPAVEAGATGVRNILRWLDMLPGSPEPIRQVPVIDAGFPVRRDDSARAPVSGIVRSRVRPGQQFEAGGVLGEMVDIFGRPSPGGEIVASADGWLIGWSNGIAKYQGQVVASLAVRDVDPLICLYPD